MPIVANTTLTTRKANTIMAGAFLPRAKEWIFPRVCGSYTTTSLTEPHVIGGAAPPLKRFQGDVVASSLPSWSLEIPNPLHKNLMDIDREELEGDQTRLLMRKADDFGVALADYPEQLWAARLLKGGLTASATDKFRGKSYQVTMDGLPMFSAVHKLDGTTSQSNIIQGSLPSSLASLLGGDVAANAQLMQRDLMNVIYKLKTVTNDKGVPLFPTLDVRKNIVVLAPSALEVVGSLAFRQAGAVLGGSYGSSGSTGSSSTIGPMFVKDFLTSGYLDGLPDPEGTTTLSPAYPTSYYVLLVNDRVKPFYVQYFKPVDKNDLFPEGYNVESVINSVASEAKSVGLEGGSARQAATLFASTIVEHNLNAVGAQATRDVVETERHFISSRFRGNVVYGPWFTAWRVDPAGSSGG